MEYYILQYADPNLPNYYTDVLPEWLAGGYGYFYIGTGILAAVDAVPIDGAGAIEAVSEQH